MKINTWCLVYYEFTGMDDDGIVNHYTFEVSSEGDGDDGDDDDDDGDYDYAPAAWKEVKLIISRTLENLNPS